MTVPLPKVGESFTRTHTFSTDEIREFARLIGDSNPLHHDGKRAAASRFGGLIASGGHTVSVMMGAAAAWMSKQHDNVGLGYSVRLRRAVPAGATCTIAWRIVSLEPNARRGGTVANLEGSLVNEKDEAAVIVTAQALIFAPKFA